MIISRHEVLRAADDNLTDFISATDTSTFVCLRYHRSDPVVSFL